MSSATFCFLCMRCEYPICSRDDLILTGIAGGTTASAFGYDLEDLLNVEDPVPCYSGDETTEVSVTVSERILSLPLPPAARLLAAEAVVDSQRAQLSEMDAQFGRRGAGERAEAPDGPAAEPAAAAAGDAEVAGEGGRRGENVNRAPSSASVSRRGRVSKFRVDLVCVRASVDGYGLVLCEKDRGVHNPNVKAAEDVSSGDVESMDSDVAASGSPYAHAMESLPSSVLEASRNPPSATEWSSHPGNFTVEESFIRVRRRTTSAQIPWFESYSCQKRLECPDCHLGLGYLFVRKDPPRRGSSDVDELRKEKMDCDDNKGAVNESQPKSNEGHEPHQKRERREDAVDEAHERSSMERHNRHHGETDAEADSFYTDTFIGLELKKIRQSRWGLIEFQKRYKQAQSLHTFRELFPEAEELESFYGRLTALRTQSELYNNLLRKHREQNDVQQALLKSQKDRIGTYEEKLRTMQQIIEAQKIQLEMQGRQIKHQEQLVRNHENQVITQQQQIRVEQLLLNEQSRTINSQREQLTLIQTHLQARHIKDQLQVRHGVIENLLRRISHSRDQQQPSTLPDSYPLATSKEEEALDLPEKEQSLPPPHLIGIIGHARKDENEDCGGNPAVTSYLGEAKKDTTTETTPTSSVDVIAEESVFPVSPTRLAQSPTTVALQKTEKGDQFKNKTNDGTD